MSYYHLNAEEELAISEEHFGEYSVKERITLEFMRILISIYQVCFKQRGSVCGRLEKAGKSCFGDWNGI